MPDFSPIQLVALVLLVVSIVGAYRLWQKGHRAMFVVGFFVPPLWLSGFFWEAKPGSAWARRASST